MDKWNSVIFSDESKFNLYGSDGKRHVRRRKNEAFHPDYISPIMKFPEGQLACGSISSNGRLKFITGTVNASIYTGILHECLIFGIILKEKIIAYFNMTLHPVIE